VVSNQVSLKLSSIIRVIVLVAFLIVLASTAGQLIVYLKGIDQRDFFYKISNLFYVDLEANIPTFFSSFLLLFAALLLSIIAVMEKNSQTGRHVLHWAILSLIFLLMAVDEFISIHEKLSTPTAKFFGNGVYNIFPAAWVIPGITFVIVFGIFFLRFWLQLPPKIRFIFFIAGTLYIGGAIGIEIVGGHYLVLYGKQNLTYSMIATIEESLEMAGAYYFYIWPAVVYSNKL
jgi:hypothetical protein